MKTIYDLRDNLKINQQDFLPPRVKLMLISKWADFAIAVQELAKRYHELKKEEAR